MFDFNGKRVLVTQADDFMGPALCEVFGNCGAHVVADRTACIDGACARDMLASAGELDFLIVNLGVHAPTTPATDVDDAEWRHVFTHMVDPLPHVVGGALKAMTARGRGHIVVMGSASALRGMRRASTYSAARGAQLAYVQAVGVEAARHGVNVNAIAQNFVDNEMYFPPEVQSNPKFQARLEREVPLGRLVAADEDAMFAAYLCTDAARCFVGQVFPMCGGWAPR